MMIIRLFVFVLVMGGAVFSKAQDSVRVQLHGVVLDSLSGAPVYEALVEWYDANGKRQAITQTNSEGHYALFLYAGQPIELRITENGYRPFMEMVPPFEPGESAREVDLHLVAQ